VKLSFGWHATFVDGSRRVMLRKPGHSPKVVDRNLCYEFDGVRVKRIDPVSGVVQTDDVSRAPPATLRELLAECRARWGANNVTPKGTRE
jgi:hypothetical protein